MKQNQNHWRGSRLGAELGNFGYDRERLGTRRDRLLTLVADAQKAGMPEPEIARLARLSRTTIRELLREAA
jgi:hypothetical protein